MISKDLKVYKNEKNTKVWTTGVKNLKILSKTVVIWKKTSKIDECFNGKKIE